MNRDPRTFLFFFLPSLSFSFVLSTLSFYPLLSRAILSSRICDHQHAKWIKFLDYTFRVRPFFTRFRFLYLRSHPPLPPPPLASALVAVPYRVDRIPDCFSAPTEYLVPHTVSSRISASLSLSLSSSFAIGSFFVALLFPFPSLLALTLRTHP